MKLTIKNMVCRHCVESVKRVLDDELRLHVSHVELGSAIVEDELTEDRLKELERALNKEGFELIQSREAGIVDAIKRTLIDISRKDVNGHRENLKEMLAGKFGLSYTSLSRLFSSIEGRSIENYYMNIRVERVKELIKYEQMSMSEIAHLMGYSSVAHLSRQFKQVTGLTPTEFKTIGVGRIPLSEV